MLLFLLDVPSIEGTVAEARMDKVVNADPKAVYKLKSTSSSLSRNNHMFSDEMLAYT